MAYKELSCGMDSFEIGNNSAVRWSPAGTIAQAVQPAIHDVTDGSVLRSWLNSPLSSGLEQDIYKATNILHSFAQVGYLQPEKGIPAAVLQGAAGFAILSVVKVRAPNIS